MAWTDQGKCQESHCLYTSSHMSALDLVKFWSLRCQASTRPMLTHSNIQWEFKLLTCSFYSFNVSCLFLVHLAWFTSFIYCCHARLIYMLANSSIITLVYSELSICFFVFYFILAITSKCMNTQHTKLLAPIFRPSIPKIC